ncbi:MAG: alpha-galactosidase [Eubacterium sp.]|nr:alpha-galactosidase [Eubacterium sp.]
MAQSKKYILGDMQCLYFVDEENGQTDLAILPAGVEYCEAEKEKPYTDSLVQIHIVGDAYPGGYAGGRTMRQGCSVYGFAWKDQKVTESQTGKEICTILQDERGLILEHHLYWQEGASFVRCYTVFQNGSNKTVGLDMLSSFSLGKISPFVGSKEEKRLYMHRLRSVWSMEGRLETRAVEDLQLEPSWAGHAVRCERFGQVGSMPVNGYFPYLVMEDRKSDIFWGAMLAHNASWQMEAYRRGDNISISGGLADREFGHWLKNIEAGKRFVTPEAILSVCKGGGIDLISQRMTSVMNQTADDGPESEQELPIIFNEYCTTWGCPSHENISAILDAIKDKGFSYFVIDCGWYKEEGIPWDIDMGDYEVSKELFPLGLDKTVQAIKEHGLKPGIWFEIENVGEKARAYQNTDHLLKRDGSVLTTSSRRFWDMRDPWVQDYLTEKVIGTLNKYGFEYMKIDYNDTIGLGCDGAESLGEGLRQNMAASAEFVDKVKEQVPGIILENCSSGGHRLEPFMMSKCSMASFSDAHECEEIPIIAANLHRVILPRQSQIWAVIRNTDSLKRIAYSIANTFLGRMCLSGDALELSDSQWKIIEDGIAFYKKIAPIIKSGRSYRFGTDVVSYRNPKGWQGVLREGGNKEAYAVFHSFYENHEEWMEICLPGERNYEIDTVYSDSEVEVRLDKDRLLCRNTEDMRAVAVYLR